jgi:hypothetical protein
MSEKTASAIPEAEASLISTVNKGDLERITNYLETRYTLWKKRAVPYYVIRDADIVVLEKAANFCVSRAFDASTYFQAQVDDIEGIEAIANFNVGQFYNTRAVEIAKVYRLKKNLRDKVLAAQNAGNREPVRGAI